MAGITSTWTHGAPPPETETTTRLLGPPPESDHDLIVRHFADVAARWAAGEAPDDGTKLVTTWAPADLVDAGHPEEDFTVAVETEIDADALRRSLDEHVAKCQTVAVHQPIA